MAIEFALTFELCPILGRIEGACLDTARMTLSAIGLAATVYAYIESQHAGCTDPMVITPSVIGTVALAGLLSRQRLAAAGSDIPPLCRDRASPSAAIVHSVRRTPPRPSF
jgi:hypothetical protein